MFVDDATSLFGKKRKIWLLIYFVSFFPSRFLPFYRFFLFIIFFCFLPLSFYRFFLFLSFSHSLVNFDVSIITRVLHPEVGRKAQDRRVKERERELFSHRKERRTEKEEKFVRMQVCCWMKRE